MKSKIVANILIAYFVVLTIVLIIQLPKKQTVSTEPIASQLMSEEKLKNAVVLYVGSPLAIINDNQVMIDENDAAVSPEIINGKTYIPVSFLKKAFGANVSWNKQEKETTIRYNNRAIVFKNESNSIKIIDNVSENEKEIEDAPQILYDRAYIPLRIVANIFEKEVFSNDKLIIMSDIKDIFDPITEINTLQMISDEVSKLPFVGSEEKLRELIGVKSVFNQTINKNFLAQADNKNDEENKNINDLAKIDNQINDINDINDVNSSDIIKNDGTYIYYIKDNIIEIINTKKSENMEIVSEISFDDGFIVDDIYIHNKKLVVLGDENINQNDTAYIKIYDVTDVNSPKIEREINVDGKFLNSKMIEGRLYFMAKVYADKLYQEGHYLAPAYTDTFANNEMVRLDFKNIAYFPDMSEASFTTILSIDIEESQNCEATTFLGGSEDISFDENSLFIACRKANTEIYGSRGVKTSLYKFDLKEGKAEYTARASVNGAVLSKFAMDFKNGYFRVATTTMQNDEQSSRVTIFDENLDKVGEITDIANGKEIYSSRFIGDRVYFATSEKTDPLFVVNIKNPKEPKFLGELKTFDYNSYLQPYDENYLIGIGKETIIYENNAYFKGIRISMLDVSDVNSPKEVFNEVIGKRGTDTEVLYNHNALLLNKEKNILALPMYVCEKATDDEIEVTYGTFEYQGAYVYNIDVDEGFKFVGRITHLDKSEDDENNNYVYDSSKAIKRIACIGNAIFTISDYKIMANDLDELDEIDEVILPIKTQVKTQEIQETEKIQIETTEEISENLTQAS